MIPSLKVEVKSGGQEYPPHTGLNILAILWHDVWPMPETLIRRGL